MPRSRSTPAPRPGSPTGDRSGSVGSARPEPAPASSPSLHRGILEAGRPDGPALLRTPFPLEVPHALPGEEVRVEALGRGAHRGWGRVVDVLKPSPDRAVPPCSLYDVCGGCDRMVWQPWAQLEAKEAWVRSALSSFSDAHFEPIKASPLTEGYRCRTTFVCRELASPNPLLPPKLEAGTWRADSHEFLEIPACPVTAPILLEARDRLIEVLQTHGIRGYSSQHPEGLRYLWLQTTPEGREVLALLIVGRDVPGRLEPAARAVLESDDNGGIRGIAVSENADPGNRILGTPARILGGVQWLEVQQGSRRFLLKPGAFSQVNLSLATQLCDQIRSWGLDQERPLEGVLDLFCGMGSLGLQLGDQVSWGVGLEVNPAAVASARESARANGLSRWTFAEMDLQNGLTSAPSILPGRPGLVLVNPPRRGLDTALAHWVTQLRPDRILYVSCHPVTLARDAGIFRDQGYRLERVQPFDLFPHTHHVETMALFHLDPSPGGPA